MTPTEKALYVERIHDVWRKAARRSAAASAAAITDCSGGAQEEERRRLLHRSDHFRARAHKLAMLEIKLVLRA